MYLERVPVINVFILNLKNIKYPTVLITHKCKDKDIERLRESMKNIGHISAPFDKVRIDNRYFGMVLIPRGGNVYGWYLGETEQLNTKHFKVEDIKRIYHISEDKMVSNVELKKLLKEYDRRSYV